MPGAAIDSVFRLLNRAVWIVTAGDGARRGGLTATWVMQASIDPAQPTLVVGIAPNHFTAELITSSNAFAAHLLRDDQIDLAWRFALGSGRDRDKLAELELVLGAAGSPTLADCLAWLDCRVIARYDTGDRLCFWADVVDGRRLSDGPPLNEHQLFAAASAEQKAALRAALQADIEVQRPLSEAWRSRLPRFSRDST